ncbi:MAG: hypothetical protein QG556_473 [Pseudomonadota bacterium]|nr:hypothetical protein [Pseudomonadota bacterium]
MNGFEVTKFADSKDSDTFLRQIAQAVNNIERNLSLLPVYYGGYDPNGQIDAELGSIYIRTGAQSKNTQMTTPKLYMKTQVGKNGWLALIYTGSQGFTSISANQGSLYVHIPETGNAELYYKQSNDATANGWKTL